jgi:hypothetical protein
VTIVIPPGFFEFMMRLNEEEIQEMTNAVRANKFMARMGMNGGSTSPGLMRMDPILQPSSPKKKRRVSKYQREFGRQLKALKRKHPRTPVTRLMKRAHAATRKAMKRKR